MARLYLFLAAALTFPALYLRLTGTHITAGLAAMAFGVGILGAAFLLSWAAEVAQMDISKGLAVALLALITVLPEYAVDMYFAWTAAKDPVYTHYATANMTGANRLLVGLGWPVIVILFAMRFKRVGVKLEPGHRTEVLALGLASCYAIVIPIKGRLDLIDTAFLVAIFCVYMFRVSKAEVHEPELIGPAKWLGEQPQLIRRAMSLTLFLFSGGIIFLSAEPFADSLVTAGKSWGIDEFLLVQWLAPLASEAPEFIVAVIWTWRGDAQAGLGALVSSLVNQWSLLVGTLPLVYSAGLGRPGALHFDTRQSHEMWLTCAQAVLAVAILANLSLSWYGALSLFSLFVIQLVFQQVRLEISFVYAALAVLLIVRDRRYYPALFREGIKG